jgi:DNA topoisomerase-1
MRTDSTNVASIAQQQARDVIANVYGAQYVPEKPPVYTRKAKGAQEAHEAIRPTDPARRPETLKAVLSPRQLRLYTLIWQRFIASQMRNAIFDATTVDIEAGPVNGPKPFVFRATGSVIKFQGFLAIYREGRDDDEIDEIDLRALPQLTAGELLNLKDLRPEQHFTQPPPRFTEAALVKALEEHGIGRPSTYAPTIANIITKNYVFVEERKLAPTELGFIINDILVEHFPAIVDLGFTSNMEEELDEIATGQRQWVPVIREFYGPFAEQIARAGQTMERVQIRDEPTDEVCEQCGRPMVIKLGRYGRFLACTGFPECRNAKPLLERIGVACPTCGEGDVVERRSKKGRVFYGCSRYPECDFVAWDRPTGEACPDCGGPMLVANRAGTLQKCQRCGHREALKQREIEHVAGAAD